MYKKKERKNQETKNWKKSPLKSKETKEAKEDYKGH